MLLADSPNFFHGWRQFAGGRWWTAGGYYQEKKRETCKHEKEKHILPSWFGQMPRLGVKVDVTCESCGQIMAQAEWVESSMLNFELKITPVVK